MQQRSARFLSSLPFCSAWRLLLPACLTLAACASDDLSIGAGQLANEAENPNCRGGIYTGDVDLTTQEDVNELAGCQEVQGQLGLFSFPDLDLRPLDALRIVDKGLSIHASGDVTPTPTYAGRPLVPLSHLDGFGALERVGSLSLRALSAPDLSAFSHLSVVGSSTPENIATPGQIEIADCDNLTDLSGLDQVVQWDSLSLTNDAQLESLQGLDPTYYWVHQIFNLSNLPKLKDLSALKSITADQVHLVNVGVESLADLPVHVSWIEISQMPELVQLDDYQGLTSAERIELTDNPRLDHYPALQLSPGVLIVTGNASLRSIAPSGGMNNPIKHYEIANNPQLVDIAVQAKLLPSVSVDGLPIQVLSIHDNPNLKNVSIEGCPNVGILSIENNPALNALDVASLQTVNELHVTNNPQLSTAPFAQVKTFESEISGNLDAPTQ